MSLKVVALILTNGTRPAMLRRALDSALLQIYAHLEVLVVDSSARCDALDGVERLRPNLRVLHSAWKPGYTVGGLRNFGISMADEADVIAHFDDDDWSNPLRVEDQIGALEAAGADIVGYRSMLLWDETKRESWLYCGQHPKACVGASLLYRRSIWKERPFAEVKIGEDSRFLLPYANTPRVCSLPNGHHRLICSVHGGNTGTRIPRTQKPEWTRTRESDKFVAAVMGHGQRVAPR
jgi:glycosyltransferase involved in cell wall biosynthesis